MKEWFSNNKLYIIGAIAGAARLFILAANRMCIGYLSHYFKTGKQYSLWFADGCFIVWIV